MKLALRDLLHNKKRYLLITVIIVLLMFMVLFLSGLVDGLGRAVCSGIDSISGDTFLLKDDAECLITVSSVTEEQRREAETKAKGECAVLNIFRTFMQREGSSDKNDITYFAVEPDSFLSPEVYSGEKLSESEQPGIVLAEYFEAKGVSVGDIIKDSGSGTELRVTGFSKDRMYGHIPAGYITYGTFTGIMEKINPGYQKKYSALVIEGEHEDIYIEGLETYTKKEIIDKLPGYQAEQMTIKLVDWLLVIITAVIIGIFFFVINIQKEKEFGVMKAIGVSMGELALFIACEVGTVALAGALTAAGLAAAMAAALPVTMPFYLQAGSAALILAVFVLISLAGSLFSIGRVAKIDPAGIIGGDGG